VSGVNPGAALTSTFPLTKPDHALLRPLMRGDQLN